MRMIHTIGGWERGTRKVKPRHAIVDKGGRAGYVLYCGTYILYIHSQEKSIRFWECCTRGTGIFKARRGSINCSRIDGWCLVLMCIFNEQRKRIFLRGGQETTLVEIMNVYRCNDMEH